MGDSSSTSPEYGFRPFSELPPAPQVRSRSRRRRWLHLVLFLLTVASTLMVGADHFAGFYGDFGTRTVDLSATALLLSGLWYSASILAILGAHEFGHYYACRYYGVDASLPFFLPAPLPLTGTLGAFIRIRQPIPGKRELFDIGIAGPIAGFMVAVPVLLVGMGLSRVTALPGNTNGFVELGEPLLFKAVAWLYWGTPPDGYSINMHPMAFAAWFGMLATALNLFPIGQLDGGHISYAVLGPRSTYVTFAMLGVALVLTYFSSTWIVWTGLMIVMLYMFGPSHPRVYDEDEPLDRPRLLLALFAVVMFVLCFTPSPITIHDLIKR